MTTNETLEWTSNTCQKGNWFNPRLIPYLREKQALTFAEKNKIGKNASNRWKTLFWNKPIHTTGYLPIIVFIYVCRSIHAHIYSQIHAFISHIIVVLNASIYFFMSVYILVCTHFYISMMANIPPSLCFDLSLLFHLTFEYLKIFILRIFCSLLS